MSDPIVDRTMTCIGNFVCDVMQPHPLFPCRSEMPKAMRTSTSLKEIVMNEELELEIVELGDAKEQTKGTRETTTPEDHPLVLFRAED